MNKRDLTTRCKRVGKGEGRTNNARSENIKLINNMWRLK